MAQNGNSNTRRKNHRNQTLEISSSPRTSNSGIISNFINQPDAVNVVDFLASKTEEIKRMEQLLFQNQPVARGRPSNLPTIDRLVTLRDRLHSGKRQFQMLPKHLRRRAASHNIYRLPRKLRGNAIKEIVKSGSASIEQFQEQRKKMKKKNETLNEGEDHNISFVIISKGKKYISGSRLIFGLKRGCILINFGVINSFVYYFLFLI